MGAHVWTDRAYGWYTGDSRDCTVATRGDGKNHSVYKSVNGQGNPNEGIFDSHTNHGSKWIEKFSLGPGEEQEISVVLDWNRANVQKDWSLVAWGTGGKPVSVTHTDPNLTSDHMPTVGNPPQIPSRPE